nr:hypothetical protein [Candidatus Sigynarchaeota archaeon]
MVVKKFEPTVFMVKDPPCQKCHESEMDFKLVENVNGDGLDWVQWYCKNNQCGHYINIELV